RNWSTPWGAVDATRPGTPPATMPAKVRRTPVRRIDRDNIPILGPHEAVSARHELGEQFADLRSSKAMSQLNARCRPGECAGLRLPLVGAVSREGANKCAARSHEEPLGRLSQAI